ncbi:MAG: D-2-hydroxyacid dehydrogenase [Lachnospiraceae bacterium]|nr:D-2-hydroxyacid dehydrogenase [Lachnospiraceae bacterium]MBQ1415693.1 D-2-hydroxyacid dehydrogenase [Lachnospiraceae bacterium]MBR0106507.1 D-2-hydroxyacid dehydrogenase [Lachnospiraceae bacterium]MBR2738223.1 D-2-hydroxyacid dehydrogenase [Lachnospiraceae bacterium]
MKKILFVTPIAEDRRARFTEIAAAGGAELVFLDREAVTDDDLRDAEVILGNLPPQRLTVCEKLRWLQLDSAGANNYGPESGLAADAALTNASGAYGIAISEHMVGCVLMVMKNLANYMPLQERREFRNLGGVKTVYGAKVLAVGMGDIGSNFAKRMHALGATVYGVRRNTHEKPDYVERLFTPADMDEILPEVDVVGLSLPETGETEGMFDYERLKKIRPGAILVNVGRGTAIVTDDLVRAAGEGHFAGVCLDVTDPEPLPADHPLWDIEHVYITPHISGRFNAPVTYEIVLDIFAENLRRYLAGEPLENRVDRGIGY